MISERLQQAHVALARGAMLDAAVPLLSAWEETRAAPLAEVYEALAAQLWPTPPLARSGKMPAPGGKEHLPALWRWRSSSRFATDVRSSRSASRALPDVERAVSELTRACAALPELTPADASAAAELAPLVHPQNDRLLEGVLAAPGDASLRAVYGDWLLERGDPRGELIALQLRDRLDAAAEARVAALLRKHTRTWVGAIAHVVRRESMVFRRGFPRAVHRAKANALDGEVGGRRRRASVGDRRGAVDLA
jgi:uncharacterized protein (TIGR02996 family)